MPRRSLSPLIKLSTYLNQENCFPKRIEIDDATSTQLENKLHKDWMNDFAQFLYHETRDSKHFESSEEILEKMRGHIRKRTNPAQNTIANETEKLFKLIWCVIKFTQDKTIFPGFNYKAEQGTSVAIELVDGLKNCSNGVYERCASHWKRMSSAQTIDNELYAMLVELITNLAHRHFEEDEVHPAMEVHEKDLYFINAKALGIPLEASGAHYHNSPPRPLYQARICEELNQHYTPLQINAYLENRMRSSLKENNYAGPKAIESGGYKLTQYQSWPQILSELLGIKFEKNEVYQMDEDYIYIIDVNWPAVRKKIINELNANRILNSIDTIADLEKTVSNKFDLMCWIQLLGNLEGYQRILNNAGRELQKTYLRYEYRKALLDILNEGFFIETDIDSETNASQVHQFFDDKIVEIIKRDGLTSDNYTLFFQHGIIRRHEINQKHTDIDEFLTEETVIEFFSDWESYDSSILRGIIKIVERFDLETQFKIISSAGHDGVTPLMNAPQISDEAVQILLQAIKKFSAEKRFELFAQRSEKQSSPLLLSAMNNQAGLNAMLAEISTYSYENRLELLSAKNIENANILTLAMRSNTNDASAIKLLIELIGTLHEDEQINLVFNESIYGDHALASSILSHTVPENFDFLISFIGKMKLLPEKLDKLLSFRVKAESIIEYPSEVMGWSLLMLAARYQPRTVAPLLSMLTTCGEDKLKDELTYQIGAYQDTPLILASFYDADATKNILDIVTTFSNEIQYEILSAHTKAHNNSLMEAASHNPDAIIPLITAMKNLTIEQQKSILLKQGMRDESAPHAQGHALAIAAVKQPNSVKPLCDYVSTFDWQTQKLLLTKKNDDDKTMLDLIKAHHPEALEGITEFVTTTNAMCQLEQLVHNYCHPPRTFMSLFVSVPSELFDVEITVNQTIKINNEIIKTLFLLCVNAGIDKIELNKETRLLVYLAKMLNQPEFAELRKVVNKDWLEETDIKVSHILEMITPARPSDLGRPPINRKNDR